MLIILIISASTYWMRFSGWLTDLLHENKSKSRSIYDLGNVVMTIQIK